MFCSNCGAQASGNFCWKCGTRLHNGAAARSLVGDWSAEIRYERLIRIPEVRDRLARHAALAPKRMSGEDFLAFCDKAMPLGVSLEKLGSIVQPVYAELGIRTGQERAETLDAPTGAVLVSALCSLARRGQTLQQVRQFGDGCLLEAVLPSDLWSWEGLLYVTVRSDPAGTRVDGATSIKGQLFDWGKSRRCLDGLFADLRAAPA